MSLGGTFRHGQPKLPFHIISDAITGRKKQAGGNRIVRRSPKPSGGKTPPPTDTQTHPAPPEGHVLYG